MDRLSEAVDASLRLMKSRERFPGEIREALLHKGFTADEANAAVDHLTKKGLLSEARAAEAVLLRRSGRRAVGNARLALDLERRGASAPLPQIEERGRAMEALSGRAGKSANPGQVGRFLVSRGFSDETIRSILEELFPEAFG